MIVFEIKNLYFIRRNNPKFWIASLRILDKMLAASQIVHMAYPEALKKFVIKSRKNGKTIKQISEITDVPGVTIQRWLKEAAELAKAVNDNGNIKSKLPRIRKRKFSDKELLEYIDKNPDRTYDEIGAHFNVSGSAAHKRCKKINITFKKKLLNIEKQMKNEKKNSEKQ